TGQSSRATRIGATRSGGRYPPTFRILPIHIARPQSELTMDPILLGKGITDDVPVTLQPKLGNRHGLVAGATGTGKTVTLMTLAEGFS
ncbi:DUF853 family protein, partial [Mycobacterium tuberculosis]|nr:DUF853 family protein [Mycobacterium tuberculosis]